MMTPTLLNNRYKVLGVLGNGGFGETFIAEDTQMPSNRRCVIKQLKPVVDNLEVYQLVQQRFQQEAAILEELGDSCNQIPRLYAYFTENGLFYLVQEFIEGQTLTQKLQHRGLLSEAEVREILINILPILDYVHSKGMVHRDIKPDNIILRSCDGKPVLIDFGAVKVTMRTEVAPFVQANSSIVIGTPGFMPTEQLVGRPLFSSDLYSLGLTAIYLLTGKMPQGLDFDASGEILWRHFAFNVSHSFADILDKAVRKLPPHRYASAKEMLLALQAIANPIVPTIPVSHPVITPPPQPQSGVVPWLQGVMIGSVIGACVLGGFWFIKGQTPAPITTVVQPTSSPISSDSTSSSLSSGQSTTSSTSSLSSKQDQKPSTSTDDQPSNKTSKPITTDLSEPTPITQQEAQNLINKWLQAKRVMFAPPYNPQPAAELTTGEQYENSAGVNGSINSLKTDGHYYKFGVQTIDEVDEFSVDDTQAIIQVKVTEERTLFDKNGNILPKETDFKTRTVRYSLQFVDERWKIASTQIITN